MGENKRRIKWDNNTKEKYYRVRGNRNEVLNDELKQKVSKNRNREENNITEV